MLFHPANLKMVMLQHLVKTNVLTSQIEFSLVALLLLLLSFKLRH